MRNLMNDALLRYWRVTARVTDTLLHALLLENWIFPLELVWNNLTTALLEIILKIIYIFSYTGSNAY